MLLYFVVVTLILTGFVWAGMETVRAEARHRVLMVALAERRGWTWTANDDRWLDLLAGPALGEVEESKRAHARNVLTGTHDGRDVVVLDYVSQSMKTVWMPDEGPGSVRTVGGGTIQSRTGLPYASLVALSVGVATPTLAVTRDRMDRRMSARVRDEIHLESEDFNQAFQVDCEDPRFAWSVLSPRVMELMMAAPPDFTWQLAGGYLVLIVEHLSDEVVVERQLAWLTAWLDRVPAFVWDDLRAAAPPEPGLPLR